MVNDPVKGIYRRPPCELLLDNLDFSQMVGILFPTVSERVFMSEKILEITVKEVIKPVYISEVVGMQEEILDIVTKDSLSKIPVDEAVNMQEEILSLTTALITTRNINEAVSMQEEILSITIEEIVAP
jgi:hypothetical protein